MAEQTINNQYMVYVTLTKSQVEELLKSKAKKKFLIAVEVVDD